ncbi:hypothetical protein [Catellatospora chokoriensis]|uniref:Uncharacterized protein n=1 Tax=Catellatospora chokoriensis TaxID=310353 RepID=A0A8J3JR77_9ACTN|nr:hypothetical protein [Catellatospora chokoriensis]GIF87044.1 hypothetical protein Cch02nite_04880 [Catellatospora chokoriensis]
MRGYEQSRDTWSDQWQVAATSSDSFLRLTPSELTELTGELHEVLVRWKQRSNERAARSDDTDREHVFLFFHAFPERP